MRIVQLSDKELYKILNQFYSYFENGFEFESFLKPFLESLGLSEVVVTKKTGDGGIDLLAVKNGLVEINNEDSVKYKVQAKRLSPTTTVSPEKIDALRGNLLFNEKGLFITTGKVTQKAKEQAILKDATKPVFIIDGKDLVQICIDKQIGFAYQPVYSKEAMDEFMGKASAPLTAEPSEPLCSDVRDAQIVSKKISANDIRVKIISVPRFIIDKIEGNQEKHPMTVIVNGDRHKFTYTPSRKYLYVPRDIGFWTKYGLTDADGSIVERIADWSIDDDQVIKIWIR